MTDRVQRMRTQLCLLLFYLDHISDINIDYGMRQESKGRSPLVVLRETERALGEAKRSGRNTILECRNDGRSQPETGNSHQIETSDRRVLMPSPTSR